MLLKFIFSKDGFSFLEQFKTIFDCQFAIDEPSGFPVLDYEGKRYRIPDNQTVECFKEEVIESVKTRKNLLAEHYEIMKYDKSVYY